MVTPAGPLAVDTRKAVALLAYLAAEGEQRRATLAALLWPDSDPARARGALRRTLSVLRAATHVPAVVLERDRIALDPAVVRADVWQVAEAIEHVRTHDHGRAACPGCIRVLSEAADAYRGPFLDSFRLRDSEAFDDWVDARRAFEDGRRARLVEVLVRQLTIAHRFDDAAAHVRTRLALDPLHERSHQHLMLLHAWSGRRSEAVDQYRRCVAVLDRELGVPPLADTSALYQRILAGDLPPLPGATETTTELPSGLPPHPATREPTPELPLIGRGPVLAQLLDRYELAHDHGQALALLGEAGIGKTRLADELARAVADRGGTVLRVRCHEGEASLPYAAIAELLRAARSAAERAIVPVHVRREVARLVPEAAPDEAQAEATLDAPGARARFLEAIGVQLEAALDGSRPGVVVIDDLQWADVSTLETVSYLVRRLDRRRLAIVLCARPEVTAPGADAERLFRVIASAPWGLVTELERLAPADVRHLVERVAPGRTGLAERLHEETEGVPFLLAEYLHALPDDDEPWELPPSARTYLAGRLTGLPELQRQVMSAAAVIGRTFDTDVLVPVSGRSTDEVLEAIGALVRRRLLRERDGALDFAHDKIRAEVADQLGPARRRLLHSRVAEALAAGTRNERELEARAAPIAMHLDAAGDPAGAAEHHRRAATHARRLAAHEDALGHLRAARSLGHPDVVAIHEETGDVLVQLGRYREAAASFDAASAFAEDDPTRARIEHKLAGAHLRRGDHDAADAHLRAALDLLGHPTSAAARARVQADRALAALHHRDLGEASALAGEALHLGRATGDLGAVAQAQNLMGMVARHRNDLGAAEVALRESLALATELDEVPLQVAALNNLALLRRDQHDLDTARQLLADAVDRCRLVGDRHREAALLNNLADIEYGAGDREAAMTLLKTAVALFAEVGEAQPHEPAIWKLVDW